MHTKFYRHLYVTGLLLVVVSCTINQQSFRHFTPQQQSVFELQFDYPDNWKINSYSSDGAAQYIIYDPTKPTPDLTIVRDGPRGDNAIDIDVFLLDNPRQYMENLLNMIRGIPTNDVNNSDGGIPIFPSTKVIDEVILDDSPVEIAGYPGHRISYQFTLETNNKRETFAIQRVFLLGEDRLYSFDLSTLADEKDGPFGKGFEYMISTIRPYP